MNSIDAEMLFKCVHTLLSELVDGPRPRAGNLDSGQGPVGWPRGHSGFTERCQASRHIVAGESSIAGHANHLLFSLSLMNRWPQGERIPSREPTGKAHGRFRPSTMRSGRS